MSHVRAQIRNYVATLLTGVAPWGTAVYTSRTAPISSDVDKAVRVMLTEETSETTSQGNNALQERTAQLELHLHVRGTDFDDDADAMAVAAESTLMGDWSMGGLVKALNYAGMSSEYSDEQPEAAVILMWDVTYLTREQDPETAL